MLFSPVRITLTISLMEWPEYEIIGFIGVRGEGADERWEEKNGPSEPTEGNSLMDHHLYDERTQKLLILFF